MWSRVGAGSITVVRPVGAEPGEQDRRLHLRARDRQLVVDRRAAAAPVDRSAAGGRRSSRSARPSGAAARRSAPSAARESDSSPVELERAVLEGEQPDDQPRERAGVAAVDRRAGLQAAQADAVHDELVAVLVDLRRRARARRRASTRCRPSGRSRGRASRRRRPRRAAARGARSTCRPGRAKWPSSRRGGLNLHRSPPRRRRRSPGPRAASAARCASPSPVTSSVSVPPRSGETWCELEVLDVDPLGAERLRDPGEHARAGRGRGRAARCSSPGSGYSRSSIRRRFADASPIQRARKPASPLLERRLDLLDPAAVLGERARGRASALSRKMSTQMRGFAPATRVMSRSEPPACASGSWPSTRVAPAWLTTTFASTCGTWLVSATSRSCASGSIATGRRAERRRRSRARAGSGPGRSAATGVRNHVAPSKSAGARVLGAARLGAADRVAADEARRAARRPRRRSPSSSRRR